MFFVRVLCGVRYVSMGVHQKEDLIQPMEDDIKWWSSSSLRYASSRSASRRDQVLEACRPLWWQWTCEDVPKSGSPIVEYGGAINLSSSSRRNQERWSNLRRSRSSSSSSSGLCSRQRFDLDRFSIICYLGDRVIGLIVVLSRGALEWVAW